MAKIRGIKPEFWTDEDIVDLSPHARLLFIGLWNFACDNGHLEDRSKQLKMRLLPADDVNVAELLRELAEHDRIVREDGWITVPNLTEHQRIDKRFFTTCDKAGCERPEGSPQRETRRAPSEHTTRPRVDHASPPGDGDGDGDGDGELKPSRKRATQLPEGFEPNRTNIDLAASEGVDLRREYAKFCDHHRAKGSTYKDWHLALNTWIRKAAEYGGNVRPLQRVAPSGEPVLPFAPDDRR